MVPGCDMAGVVIGKGFDVTKFDIGDEVYGNIQDFNTGGKLKQLGTLAQFIVVEESLVARKPKCLSFEEAASLPLAVQTAMEGFKTAGFKKGQTIFVVGGAGGVGTLVLQLAKPMYGASYVVATTSTPKVEFVKQLGADKVVDYTKTKYEDLKEKFDFLYDTIGKFLRLKFISSFMWLNCIIISPLQQYLFRYDALSIYYSTFLIIDRSRSYTCK